jgi:hypothetical protein
MIVAQMIYAEDDPLMRHAAAALEDSLRALANHHGAITRAFIDDVTTLITEHRSRTKRALGVDFPPMVMMVVPHLNIIELGRADWELPAIRRAVFNFVDKHKLKGLQPTDVANMVRAAWPQVKPGDLVDEARHIARERARRAYVDETFEERACDHCGKPYRGPAVFCSYECAVAAA